MICNFERKSEENQKNIKELEKVLESILGHKVKITYKEG